MLMWWWGQERKNMHFAGRNWKVNSKKPQNYPLQKCVEFAWQVFGGSGRGLGDRGAAVVVSVRSYKKLLPCQVGPIPAMVGPLLAKGELFSDGVSTPGIIYLRRERSYCTGAIAAGEERSDRNSFADTQG